ncbi:MAG TPA: response regulator [Aggregatilineales bacterium]|nr:response regulator [Aggregatilineales bacterium]
MANILLIEDDERTRQAMTDLLELGGHNVSEAVDGDAGLKAAREQQPDVILLDFSLPKMHGWAVAREIRNDPTIRDTPIVALTAHVMVATRETAMEVGCDAYLTKPIHADSFEPWFNAFLAERGLK